MADDCCTLSEAQTAFMRMLQPPGPLASGRPLPSPLAHTHTHTCNPIPHAAPGQVNETLNACPLDAPSCISTLNDDELHFAAPWQAGCGAWRAVPCRLPSRSVLRPAGLASHVASAAPAALHRCWAEDHCSSVERDQALQPATLPTRSCRRHLPALPVPSALTACLGFPSSRTTVDAAVPARPPALLPRRTPQFEVDRAAAIEQLLAVACGGEYEPGLIDTFGGISQVDAAAYIAKGVLAVATGGGKGWARASWPCCCSSGRCASLVPGIAPRACRTAEYATAAAWPRGRHAAVPRPTPWPRSPALLGPPQAATCLRSRSGSARASATLCPLTGRVRTLHGVHPGQQAALPMHSQRPPLHRRMLCILGRPAVAPAIPPRWALHPPNAGAPACTQRCFWPRSLPAFLFRPPPRSGGAAHHGGRRGIRAPSAGHRWRRRRRGGRPLRRLGLRVPVHRQ